MHFNAYLRILEHISGFDDGKDEGNGKRILAEYILIKLFGNYYGAARSRQFIGDDASSDNADSRNSAVLDQYFGRTTRTIKADIICADKVAFDVSDVILDYRLMLDNVSSIISDVGNSITSAVKSVSNLLFSQTLTSAIPPDNGHLDLNDVGKTNDKDDRVSTSELIGEPEESAVGKFHEATKANNAVGASELIGEPEELGVGKPAEGAKCVLVNTPFKHPKNAKCILEQALKAKVFHSKNSKEPIYYNPSFVYQYEHSNTTSFGYSSGDAIPRVFKMTANTKET